MGEDLQARFKKAVWLIQNGPKMNSSNDTKLKFYKYYKQATEGDVKGDRPWMTQVEKRAKWDAWNSVKGTSKEAAMQNYVELLEDPDVWENHEKLKEYPGPQWMTV